MRAKCFKAVVKAPDAGKARRVGDIGYRVLAGCEQAFGNIKAAFCGDVDGRLSQMLVKQSPQVPVADAELVSQFS